MWRDLSPSLLLFLRWVWQPVFFCDDMRSILWWLERTALWVSWEIPGVRRTEVDDIVPIILKCLVCSALKASHICTEWITRLDVVWRVVCFESLLLFIIPTARRVCSYPGRAGLSTMLGFEVLLFEMFGFLLELFFVFFFSVFFLL